jgi:hypothetical protein
MMQGNNGIIFYMKKYHVNKRVRELLTKINPLLAKKEENIRIHLEALVNRLISEEEFKVIESKMMLGKLCLELEELIPNSYVTILFYNRYENKIYHGAAPSFPVEFFDFFHDINNTNAFGSNCGSCGYAVHNRKMIVTDIETSPLWRPFKDYFMKRGYVTGWSIPFFRDHDVIGTFAIYHKYKKQVKNEELQLVKSKVMSYQDEIYFMSNQLIEKEA